MSPESPPPPSPFIDRMLGWIRLFERAVILVLVGLMAVVVAVALLDLAWILFQHLASPPLMLMEVGQLLEVLGFFLLVLIGLELLETVRAYLRTNVIHVELVLEVALVAVARKVIVLDLERYSGTTLLSIAAIILALALAFRLARLRRTG